jgi:N-acetylglucosaminyldiphosphoundecaprenol N-acetyl-beta-D-mannosaminyltransferase
VKTESSSQMPLDSSLPRISILGVPIHAISHHEAITQIAEWIDTRYAAWGVFCTVYNVMLCREDSQYRAMVNAANLVLPDGMPLVWLSHRRGYPQTTRIYGPDLMLLLTAYGLERGYKHYYYGSTPQVIDRLQANLMKRYPELRVAGSYSPPFRPLTSEEDSAVIRQINEADPDIIWVGLGTPKQDMWMHTHRSQLRAPILLGVGAAFDIHAGFLPQAPRWMQRSGLEWLFRLLVEPRRLWRRYLLYNPAFIYHILLEMRIGKCLRS